MKCTTDESNSKAEVIFLQLTDQGDVKLERNVYLRLEKVQLTVSELTLLQNNLTFSEFHQRESVNFRTATCTVDSHPEVM